MSSFPFKHVVLGISGGIAAYKSAELVRLLSKQGVDVRVVMTSGAQAFITPMTLQALSGNPVHSELFDAEAEAAMGHIDLAKWADLILIAPATAHCIAKLSHGMADDLLSTLCLATEAPIAIAPAMNQAMWHNKQTQTNVEHCEQALNIRILGPGEGQQACGDVGQGRMLEPSEIVATLNEGESSSNSALSGKHIVITAGPTQEALDPVRFLTNPSSGKMGFSLAQAAVKAGAKVTLIAGPVSLKTPHGVTRIDVKSAMDMHAAALASTPDIFIACAAVADYRPKESNAQKIKKTEGDMQVTFTRNPDILADIAQQSHAPFCVGFAAETNDVKAYALDKMKRKNLAMIISNDITQMGAGFAGDQNQVSAYWQQGGEVQHQDFALMSKAKLGEELIHLISQTY